MSRRISVSHLGARLEDWYLMSALATMWRRRGHEVTVGESYADDADICILHHDRTCLDAAALPTPPAGVRVLNGEVLDISKRTYSSLALKPVDDWRGPVIIKTNLNHFGVAEDSAAKRGLIDKARRRLARISWRAARMLPERFYPVLDSISEVPDWVWGSPHYLVERFLPERTPEGHYCVRGWSFFGDKSYGYRVFSTHPLVKTGTMIGHDYLDTAPPQLLALRERLKFDFGKFDYVEHDGEPILLDANKTPTSTGNGESPRLKLLAEGVEAYLS